jgi:hypothetical protein
MPSGAFDRYASGVDPAVSLQIAHDTATALVRRIRESDDPAVLERLLAYTADHGVGELAELWSAAPAHSLPGALWRLYVIHASIVADESFAAAAYDTGAALEATADVVVAGAPPLRPTTFASSLTRFCAARSTETLAMRSIAPPPIAGSRRAALPT